jgi:glutaconate CoA-transferase subunit A
MADFLSLHDAVQRNLHPGDIVAFEGFTHLIPHTAAHEAIRQGIGELTLIRMTPDIVYDQMMGMGLAKNVVFSYAGNPGVGLPRHPLSAQIETDARSDCRWVLRPLGDLRSATLAN